jgi:hypothetical protein
MNDRTKEILNRFERSWNETELFYEELINNYTGWGKLIPVLELIRYLKQNGEDKFFRLSTSIYILIISRSVDYSLREDQKRISVDTISSNDFKVSLFDGRKTYREYSVTSLLDPKMLNLIKTLKDTLAD